MRLKKGKNFILKDKRSFYLEGTVTFGDNVTVYENVRIEGNTTIGNDVTIYPNTYIKDCIIGNGVTITSSHLEGAVIYNNVNIGPFARLRPSSIIEDNAKIGNFVEIKNAVIGKNSKVSHLAYVGDAEIGKNCNIGCGAIFVNYNGKIKQKTIVKDNCFIGSNCNIIAPVVIDNNSYVCAGTTITEKVNEDDFVIGRVRQQVKANRAHEYLKSYQE